MAKKDATPSVDPIKYLDFLFVNLKFDRYFYLAATGLCIIILIWCVTILVARGDILSAIAVCAPAGGLGMCINKIIKFWSDCLQFIVTLLGKVDKEVS
jgi:hypothetical protein